MSEIIFNSEPTIYKGILFRSKMEARVAVLLDEFQAEWEFEPIQEAGYTPDFLVKNVVISRWIPDDEEELKKTGATYGQSLVRSKEDLFIEVKYSLFPGNAVKIEKFSEDNNIIIAGSLPLKQYTNRWGDFGNSFLDKYIMPLKGDNPKQLCPWSYELIDGSSEMAVPVILKSKEIGLARNDDIDLVWDFDEIDVEKTLLAYKKAQSYCFEAITEKQQEQIERLKKENQALKEKFIRTKFK